MPTISDVHTIVTRPGRQNLVVVKVLTSDNGLHGLGCATFTQRYHAVVAAIEKHLRPLLLGRDVSRIEELWRLMHTNGYWRGGPVLNNAISGIDTALWDIAGKRAGMPVHDLLGGRFRTAALTYHHATGRDLRELTDDVQRLRDAGFTHIRVQYGGTPATAGLPLGAGTAGYGGRDATGPRPEDAGDGQYYDPHEYMDEAVAALMHVRNTLPDIHLLHDVHSRLEPADAVDFARRIEPLQLFFLEDLLPPEHFDWLANVRAVCTTPLAIGELFTNPAEYVPLVRDRRIDFIRAHLSAIGGLTPARKLAAMGELCGVRTAWHGPADVSPVGHAANLALDVSCPNFGIQESVQFSQATCEVFQGCPATRGRYLYPNDAPGWGIEIDEAAARRFPPDDSVIGWTQSRRPDGGLSYP